MGGEVWSLDSSLEEVPTDKGSMSPAKSCPSISKMKFWAGMVMMHNYQATTYKHDPSSTTLNAGVNPTYILNRN